MSANERPPRKWEDLTLGEETQSRELTLMRDEMIEFATRYDPQFFHADPEGARGSFFGDLIASGIYTAALWRMLDHEENGNVDWVCGVQWDNVRWRLALRAGDRVRAHSRVISKRPSASRPGIGLAVLEHWMTNQDRAVVFEFASTDLVHRREGGAA
jgi:acyl dehydratase